MLEEDNDSLLDDELSITDDGPVELDDASDDSALVDDATDDGQAEQLDEDEDEKLQYSRKVQKRIDKLTYNVRLEQRKNAEKERELLELKSKVEALSQHRAEEEAARSQQAAASKRTELLAKKKEALDLGDFDTVIEIDEELFALREQAQGNASGRGNSPTPPPPAQPQQQTPAPPAAQQQWEAKNMWLYDPAQSARKAHANNVFSQLINEEGFSPDDEDTYAELDKRLQRQKPPPTGAPDRGRVTDGRQSTGFTATDRQRMLVWGLNPDNPVERKEWIRNKIKEGGKRG